VDADGAAVREPEGRADDGLLDGALPQGALSRGFASGTDGGLIVLPNSVTNSNRELIANLAARYRMPAIYAYRSYVTTGGLASYGIEPTAPFRDAAGYVNRILKGAMPADLPVHRSK
jgi:putative ABC transport system substrate-binding protein